MSCYNCSNTLSAFYSIKPGDRFVIHINIVGGDGNIHKIKILSDTGNDRTLLKRSTAKKLGFNVDNLTPYDEFLEVSGIKDEPAFFKAERTQIQLGNLPYIPIRVGLALHDSELVEDLLGREDVLTTGILEVIYDHDSVEYRIKPEYAYLFEDNNSQNYGSYGGTSEIYGMNCGDGCGY